MARKLVNKASKSRARKSLSIVDPRRGDIEDDVSSTKRRSMMSLFGSMLVEISFPKLIFAWILLLVVPGLLLGLAPIVFIEWLTLVTDKLVSLAIGFWSLLLLAVLIGVGWFGWRSMFRTVEKNFWALNSIVVEPGYAAFREAFRELAERVFGRRANDAQRARLRAAAAAIAGILVCGVAILVLWLLPVGDECCPGATRAGHRFADIARPILSKEIPELWARVFPMVVPPAKKDAPPRSALLLRGCAATERTYSGCSAPTHPRLPWIARTLKTPLTILPRQASTQITRYFTQVVGEAAERADFWDCRYSPAGNVAGAFPANVPKVGCTPVNPLDKKGALEKIRQETKP